MGAAKTADKRPILTFNAAEGREAQLEPSPPRSIFRRGCYCQHSPETDRAPPGDVRDVGLCRQIRALAAGLGIIGDHLLRESLVVGVPFCCAILAAFQAFPSWPLP